MAHFFTVPINTDGATVDANVDVTMQAVARPLLKCTDLSLYSYGWWNASGDTATDCSRFSVCFAQHLQHLMESAPAAFQPLGADLSSLALDLHLPSTVSETKGASDVFFNAASFFTTLRRTDEVGTRAGYSLLNLMIEACQRQPSLRLHLVGHSFGCRVLCSALQRLASDSAAVARVTEAGTQINLVLLQPVADADCFSPDGEYGGVLQVPNLRVLVTKSARDRVLGKWYLSAQRLAHLLVYPQPALGSIGPMGLGCTPHVFAPGRSPVAMLGDDFVVADLTPVHRARAAMGERADDFGGQHADINSPEIYELVARFLQGRGINPAAGKGCQAAPAALRG